MAAQPVTTVTCPNCRRPFNAPLRQIIDAQADPEAKSRILSGQLNFVVCPNCGYQGALNVPFFYHDADLELALVYMPMELGTTDMERQRAIGDLTNRVLQQLPPEKRKGYLLQPRTFFSVESLTNAMLEVDTETREVVEAQRRKMELIEQLRELDPNDRLALAEFVGKNDQEMDVTFFQLLDILIGLADSRGDETERERLNKFQEALLERTSTGKLLTSQREAVEALTANPTRENLIEQLTKTEDRTVREALVMVGRGLLDYPFFQALTRRIDAAEAAGDAATHQRLVNLRKEIQDIRDDVDAMTMAVFDARAVLLRELMMAQNPRELMMRRLLEIDNAFFSVLSSNIQQAEAAGRHDVVPRLRQIGDIALEVLNETAPPEIKLINQLAAAADNEQVRRMLQAERELLNEEFVELLEDAAENLEQRNRRERAARLRYAIEQTREMVGTGA